MLRILPAVFIIVIALALFPADARPRPDSRALATSDSFVITAVTLIDGSGRPPVPDTAVVVDRGRITYVGPSAERPQSAQDVQSDTLTIDGRGKFLIPGLIDTHAHVTYLDWVRDAAGNSNAVYNDAISRETLRLLLKFGVTTVRNPGGPTGAATALRDRVAAGEIRGPRIFTAGDILNRVPRFDGLTRPVATEADIEREIAAQVKVHAQSQSQSQSHPQSSGPASARAEAAGATAAGVDYIKIYGNLPPPLVDAAIRAAHARGLKVIGHLQATSWAAAARMGIDAICHGASWSADELRPERREAYQRAIAEKGAMRARMDWLDWVEPDGPVIQAMIAELAKRRIPVDPTLIAYATKFTGDDPSFLKSPDLLLAPPRMRESFPRVSFVSDWTAQDFAHGHESWRKMNALIRAYHRGGVLLTAGSDEPNAWIVPGPSLHTELQLLVASGLSPLDTLTLATRNAAESLGILADTGTIAVGKRADLILLDKDPTVDIRNTRAIAQVIQSGRVLQSADVR